MSNPLCRIHSTEMAVSKFGGFFCRQQLDDETYCTEKIRPPKPTSIAPATSLLPKSDSNGLIAAAALHLAAELCKGAGPEMADSAIAVAVKAYSAMKAVS
jgi:hypothetical protein